MHPTCLRRLKCVHCRTTECGQKFTAQLYLYVSSVIEAFNQLQCYTVGKDHALVSPIAGTTRDVLSASIKVSGHAVTVLDTAGLRHSDDTVEQMGLLLLVGVRQSYNCDAGVARARSTLAQSDIALVVVEGQNAITENDRVRWLRQEVESTLFNSTSIESQHDNRDCIVVVNKSDLLLQNNLDFKQLPSTVEVRQRQMPVCYVSFH